MKTVRNMAKENGGFTMIEAMIALSILAVGLLSLVGMFTSSIGVTSRGKRTTEATMLASQKLEEFNYTAYDDIFSSVADEVVDACGDNPSKQVPPLPLLYTRSWVVVLDPVKGIKTITVKVKWKKTTSSEKDRQITLMTKKAADK